MYYAVICHFAGLKAIVTPIGDEVLIRPKRSKIYRHFASKALQSARVITVDSVAMQEAIKALCGKKALLVQNGIDVKALQRFGGQVKNRKRVVSLRAMDELYNIERILDARLRSSPNTPLTFIYPFQEEGYRRKVIQRLDRHDVNCGRLPKDEMYQVLSETILAISIPTSDASPRSVYEAIFCGCCVAVSDLPWINMLPACMKARVWVVDFDDDKWFANALTHANQITQEVFEPSSEALRLYDQAISMKYVCDEIYG
jgi:hypothetical protein